MRFVPPAGDLNVTLEWVKAVPAGEEPFKNVVRRSRGARKEGIRYEGKVVQYYRSRFGEAFTPGLWFQYKCRTESRPRFCQPDGLLFDYSRGHIIIVEAKLRHCADAFFQLYTLYLPVVKTYFGSEFGYRMLEICRWYDPEVASPARVRLCKDELDLPEGTFNVKIFDGNMRSLAAA